jgi:hypothetical protein
MVNGGMVSWRSKKEAAVSQSTIESEYIAGSDAGNEAIWLRKFVIELGVFPSMHDHVVLLCDNTSAIANTKDPMSHSVAKQIPRHYHVIRQYVHDNEANVCKVYTDLNVVEPLTKLLPQAKHDQHQESIVVRFWRM